VRYRLLLATLAIASAQASAQILPPTVEQPTTIAQPPAGYPPTTATAAVGPYFATPSWDQKLAPNLRFVVLTNFNNDAVLDRETGLVWARQAITNPIPQNQPFVAAAACLNLNLGGRGGWRLPASAELMSLVDFSIPPVVSQLRLPAGHPFNLANEPYWTDESFQAAGFTEPFIRNVELRTGLVHVMLAGTEARVLCVRGRQ
jgi:hypothetical protein